MNIKKRDIYSLSILLILTFSAACSRKSAEKDDYLFKIYEGKFDEFGVKTGYINTRGDTVIALGKYLYCYSDTLKNYAIVMKNNGDIIAIDRNDNELFKVYKYDNGPDYISEGLFRIIVNGKIGYADTTGKIIIEPQFDCAYPFKDGKAKVSLDCMTIENGEHHQWQSSKWFYIDRKGNTIQ